MTTPEERLEAAWYELFELLVGDEAAHIHDEWEVGLMHGIEAAARAPIEAERDELRELLEHQRHISGDNADYWSVERARVAELEAERDALREALEKITKIMSPSPDPWLRSARTIAHAALLPPEEQGQ